MNRRILFGLIIGAILGIFCIIGASVRSTEALENYYLFSFWLNRLFMGFVIGLLAYNSSLKYMLLRGAVVGLFVSFLFYSATNFHDLIGFLVGAVYGVIIEYGLHLIKVNKNKRTEV